jgi:hypothetical protein
MRLINKLIEPKKILIVWQAPNNVLQQQPVGHRFVVGEINNDGKRAWLTYYNNQDTKNAQRSGFTGLTAYPYEPDKTFSGNVVAVLSTRLPPASRTDYDNYLLSYRISPQAEGISALSLLAYTTGKLAGDGFAFLHSFENTKPAFDFTFEIAGFRHHGLKAFPTISILQDKEVSFAYEPFNAHDNEAMAITYQGKKLGYVPKGFTCVLKGLIETYQISAFIERINGTPERPSILIFVEVR